MSDWTAEYAAADDLNRKYAMLREEITRLRGRRDDIDFFDVDAVRSTVRRLDESLDGDLLVFLANDFGLPQAYRPSHLPQDVQDDVRTSILEGKYDDSNEDLDEIRRELLDDHPCVHKAIVAAHDDGDVRYYLPEGSNHTTNFVTVREMVGLVDYTTHSFQADSMSQTY